MQRVVQSTTWRSGCLETSHTSDQGAEDQFGLAVLQYSRRQAALFFQLDDGDRRRDPAGIERLQIMERPAPQMPDGEEIKADRGRSRPTSLAG